LIFLWVFVPWLQKELNAWLKLKNESDKRADKNKILPHGKPSLIFESPELFDSYDFKVSQHLYTDVIELQDLWHQPVPTGSSG
jgi:hypothetical protein